MELNLLIINKEKLKNLILTFKNRKKTNLNYETPIGLITAILLSVIATKEYNSFVGIPKETIKFVMYLILVICALYLIFIVIYKAFHKRHDNYLKYDLDLLEKKLIELSEHKIDNTLILLFARFNDNKIEFLVQRKDSWNNSYFFPYIHDEKDKDISELKNEIKQKIINKYSISTQFNILHIVDLNSSSIKLNTEYFPKTFNYRFLLIYPKSSFMKSTLNEELKGFEFKSIDDLLNDRLTIKHNEDVILEIKENLSTIEKRLKIYSPSNSKIVWNIDKTCSKGCSFCAYGNQSEKFSKLSLDEMKQLIISLKSVNINSIDIATGDSPHISELKEILQYIKTKLKARLSLTTTSEVIEKFDIKFLKKYIDSIEITYDYPRAKQFDFRSKEYNQNNYKIAKELIKQGITIEALVVLHNKMIFKDITEIKRELKMIGVKKILLLRLMPVGKQDYETYPVELKKRETFEKTLNIQQISSDGVKLHCALQGLQKIKNPCEMGTSKLGISSNGDIFICPWAEHIENEINPFRLGNLLNDAIDLKSFLQKSTNYQEVLTKNEIGQPHCKIFCFYNSNDIFTESDELYNL